MQKMRSLIGMIVAGVAVVAILLLEIAGHVETVERLIPERWMPMINEKLNFALIAVAILIFIAAYLDHKSEKRKFARSNLGNAIPAGVPSQPSIAAAKPSRPTHKVQFISFKRIQIDPDFSELALATLCFENVLIPGDSIADFHFARLQVNYSDSSTGDAIAEVFLARWHDSPAAPIDICAGRKCYAIIASCIGSKWATDALIDTPINPALEYGFGGSEYKHESVPLPLGRIKVKATLIGALNLSIPPVEGFLTLGRDGNASFLETSS